MSRASPIAIATAVRTSIAGDDDLVALYEPEQDQLLWFDTVGHPTSDATEAVALLRTADLDGLMPDDYWPDATFLDSTSDKRSSSIGEMVELDVRLSIGLLRYFRALHLGRVDPRAMGFATGAHKAEGSFVEQLRDARARHDLAAAALDLAPALETYRALKGALARYRRLMRDPRTAWVPSEGVTIRPGEGYPHASVLRARLIAFGDLQDVPVAPLLRYDEELVTGVKRFQARHGLQPSGLLDRDTQRALAVPVAHRVMQIELALERLRWLPHLRSDRLIAVNIPMFRLWGWDAVPAATPTLSMATIVGRALNTRTPIFVEEMRSVVFRPFWNVPSSIVHAEILPALARDPHYLQRSNMEIVDGESDGATRVPETSDAIARLRTGTLRLRQRPGPTNALGLVKFIFPNDSNVYLHGTPQPALFGRARRDLSHGCVRVEDPTALAEWVLAGQAGWNRERIVAAMNGLDSQRVTLSRPIQVVLFYITAGVMPEDDSVHFSEDIYGHDARLEAMLIRHHARTRPVSTWTKSDAG